MAPSRGKLPVEPRRSKLLGAPSRNIFLVAARKSKSLVALSRSKLLMSGQYFLKLCNKRSRLVDDIIDNMKDSEALTRIRR